MKIKHILTIATTVLVGVMPLKALAVEQILDGG
jgi:hypothetical protein